MGNAPNLLGRYFIYINEGCVKFFYCGAVAGIVSAKKVVLKLEKTEPRIALKTNL